MTTGMKPTVFLSSTCYDLAQVRQDLRIFIDGLGMNPVLSEFNSFPVDPNLDAVANCVASVKNMADVFVLIVGGRYGSVTESGKSVTNVEYLEAKAKGIPRYVFVQKGILNALPIWEKNQSADFSEVVDSPKLLEFVRSLRDPKESWIFPFESAQDIMDALRTQLAYLVKSALDIRHKVGRLGLPENLQDLSGKALLIAVQKPFAWEYRLFGQVLADEIARSYAAKKDLEYGIKLGRGTRLSTPHEFIEWVQSKLAEISMVVESGGTIVNEALPKALGPPGQPGDVNEIAYAARRLGQVHQRLLEWSAEFAHTQVEEYYVAALKIVARASDNVIVELEQFSEQCQREINDAASRYERTKEPQKIEIALKLTCPDMSDLQGELQRLVGRLGIAGPRASRQEN